MGDWLRRPPGVSGLVGWVCAMAVCLFIAAVLLGSAMNWLINQWPHT